MEYGTEVVKFSDFFLWKAIHKSTYVCHDQKQLEIKKPGGA